MPLLKSNNSKLRADFRILGDTILMTELLKVVLLVFVLQKLSITWEGRTWRDHW